MLRRTFALTHSSFSRLLRERLVRKDPDPQFSTTLYEARDRHACRFNLAIGNPCRLEGFQTVLAKGQRATAPGLPAAPAALLFAVLHFLRHQHNRSPVSLHRTGRCGLPT